MTNEFFDSSLSKVLSQKIVVDVGGATPFQKNLQEFKKSSNSLFLTIDLSPFSTPTLRGDAHFLPLKDNSTTGVVCNAVLEHVDNPFTVIREIQRILKPGGLVYIWIPFLYPFHPGKTYGDYFRYTKDGAKLLMKNFSKVSIEPSLAYFQTLSDLLPDPISKLVSPIAKIFDHTIKINNQNAGWHIFAVK